MSENYEPEIIINMGGIVIRPENRDELNAIMAEWQDAMIAEQKEISEKLGVSDGTAAAIQYLRTRSRWTPEKELELIERDKVGNSIPLSTVLTGEF